MRGGSRRGRSLCGNGRLSVRLLALWERMFDNSMVGG